MSWREFHLRTIGFERKEKRRIEGLRLMTYQIFMSGVRAPEKHISIEKFWPLEGDSKSGLTESNISALKKAQNKALNQLNG